MVNLDGFTFDELKELVPAAFTEKQASHLSSKYSFVPTSRVINDLMTMKFKPFRAFQVNKRKGGHRYSKHQIHFRRDDLISSEEEFLEVILTNSHDGSAKFQLSIGIFVLVCSNGLVLPKQMFGELNIKHIGYSFQDLEHTLQQLIEHAPNVCKQIDVMKKRELTDEEKIKFAVSALKSRWDKEIKINVDDLLTPIRKENESNDLWTVFNIVQEKLIKGTNDVKVNNRSIRKIKNLNSNTKINKKLFETAMNFV